DDNSGHIAVLMNLAKDVLKIVPMKDMGWKNDGQGNRPKEFDEWVRELAEGLLKLITALIAAIGDFIAGLVEAAVEVGLKFVELIKAAIMWLIELILKTMLLSLIWAFLALITSILTLAIASMALMLLPIVKGFGGDIDYSATRFKIYVSDRTMVIGYETPFEYNSFLDLDVPLILFYVYMNQQKIFGILMGFFPIKYEITIEKSQNTRGEYHPQDSELLQRNNKGLDSDLQIISPENRMIDTTIFKSFKNSVEIDLKIKWDNEEPENLEHYKWELKRVKDDIFIDDLIDIDNNNEWDGQDTKVTIKNYGFYILNVTAYDNNGEIIDHDETKFYLWDWNSFISGIDSSLGIFGDIMLLIDGMLQTHVKIVQQLPIMVVSVFLFVWVQVLYGPGFTGFIGIMLGCIIAAISNGVTVALNWATNVYTYTVIYPVAIPFDPWTQKKLDWLLSIVGMGGDIMNAILIILFYHNPELGKILAGTFTSYDIAVPAGMITFAVALLADLGIAFKVPIEDFFITHVALSLSAFSALLSLLQIFAAIYGETIGWIWPEQL
ncbi:MAG: hypothetical protein ACTSPD_21785, partial [Promethearchaeota archaeon]